MLIIIEGPDKSGKSTLARALEEEGFRYHHFGFPGPDPAKEYADFLLNLKEPTVCDRFYVGERVYGPLLRGTSLLTDLKWATLERLCRLRGAVMIYTATPLEKCQARFKERKQVELISLENNEKAWEKFQEIIKQSNVTPFFKYNGSEQSNLTKIMRQLLTIIHHRIGMAEDARKFCHGIGTVIGRKLVIVGEQLNGNPGWVQLPFAHGPSSEFLLDCLKKAQVPEQLVYICNADQLTLGEVSFLLQGSYDMPWLTLGDFARSKVMEFGVEQHSIPHPAYWQRFHFKETEVYVEMIREWRKQI